MRARLSPASIPSPPANGTTGRSERSRTLSAPVQSPQRPVSAAHLLSTTPRGLPGKPGRALRRPGTSPKEPGGVRRCPSVNTGQATSAALVERGNGMRGRTRVTIVLAMVTMLTVVAVGATLAAPGGKGKPGGRSTGSSLSLVLLNSTDGVPHWGQEITFEVTTSAAEPFVNVRCYQGDAFVYDGWAGFFDGAWFGQTFTLSSMYWEGGAADCTARLVSFGSNGRERTLKTMGFDVAA